MIEAVLAITICLFICTFTIAGLFVGSNTKGRTGWIIATSFAISAVLLIIGAILVGPVPEDHQFAEQESVTQSDN